MAYIKVDHSKFANAANEVDSFVTTMKNRMTKRSIVLTQLFMTA